MLNHHIISYFEMITWFALYSIGTVDSLDRLHFHVEGMYRSATMQLHPWRFDTNKTTGISGKMRHLYLSCVFFIGILRYNRCSGENRTPKQAFSSPTTSFKGSLVLPLLEKVKESLKTCAVETRSIRVPGRCVQDVESAMQDFSSDSNVQGLLAWNFLQGIAGSELFVKEFWQRRPLLIRSKDTGGWAKGCFTVEKDLRLMDGSFITGFKTAEVLRNGTKTDTWALAPLKDNPAYRTAWSDVENAMEGGTIYFNTAGSLWKNLGGLCRLVGYSFGLPPNVNVYVTPPGK